ncbi:MAG: hypothetical protein KC996_06935 [Phycisphaerales bacterium]|nr:hypothetical protein [Phycisphaerales bacterium]
MKIVACAAIALLLSAGAAADVTTTWDSGTLEGWTFANNPNAGEWEVFSTGGNPDGYVSYIDGPDGTAQPNFLYAPGSYLGDYSTFGPGAGFSYDGIWEASHAVINAPVIRLLGAGGEIAEGFGAGFNSSGWDSFFVPLEETSWNMISGNWNDLIQNVTGLILNGDNGIGNGREAGVDNFTLVVPAPGALALLGVSGLVGFRRRR